MIVPESVLLLAGFVLAHAAWSVSDLPQGQLLVPLAIAERSGQRQIYRFEASTQVQAIEKAKRTLADMNSSVDAWAFAREGLLNENGAKVDVLSISFWAAGMKQENAIVQRFEPFAKKGTFRVLGDPMLVIDGIEQEGKNATTLLKKISDGISQHPKAGAMWAGWKR